MMITRAPSNIEPPRTVEVKKTLEDAKPHKKEAVLVVRSEGQQAEPRRGHKRMKVVKPVMDKKDLPMSSLVR
ncbi:hypothetical protein AAVH_22848 [Aphelenchoides avenae]|nr:hypothetical protein AAVH_22848 [Aphelenchus avenae]